MEQIFKPVFKPDNPNPLIPGLIADSGGRPKRVQMPQRDGPLKTPPTTLSSLTPLTPLIPLKRSTDLRGLPLEDSFGRRVKYLRLSLTDRCNFNCFYCKPLPSEGGRQNEFLTPLEIRNLLNVLVPMGVEKVRLTGGEPTLRTDLIEIIEVIRSFSSINEIALTTNGMLLNRLAPGLQRAGLSRLNISIDSLVPEKFKSIRGRNQLDKVLEGIDAALESNLNPVKLNTVLLKNHNRDEILDLTRFAQKKQVSIRFIELMPTGKTADKQSENFLGSDEIFESLKPHFPLKPIERNLLSGPAKEFTLDEKGIARVGFITPLSCNFCEGCNRIRITSKGCIRTCLFDNKEADLRPLLQDSYSGEALKSALRKALWLKPEKHQLNSGDYGTMMTLSQIGG